MIGIPVSWQRVIVNSLVTGVVYCLVYSQRGFEEITKNRAVYLIGRMFAPVYADGAIIEYPPLHIHHAHVYPFKNEEMEHKNVPKKANNAPSQGRYQSQHHVLLQAHGDSSCKPREGGNSYASP